MFADQAEFMCSVCGEINQIDVDISGGPVQQYTEDCQVCCRPNKLTVVFDQESGEVAVSTEFDE